MDFPFSIDQIKPNEISQIFKTEADAGLETFGNSLMKNNSTSHFVSYKLLQEVIDLFVVIEYFDNRNTVQVSYFKIDIET